MILAFFVSPPQHATAVYSPWWRVTHSHDIATALTLQPEFQDGGLFCILGLQARTGQLRSHCRYDPNHPVLGKVPTDGPFFFQNSKFFVKVFFICLIHDQKTQFKRFRFI